MATLPQLEGKYFAPGAPVHSDDSDVDFLIDGREYFDKALLAMDGCTGAGDAIYVLGWCWDASCPTSAGSAIPTITEYLAAKAHNGVDVRVVIWANPNVIDLAGLISFLPGAASAAGGFPDIVADNCISALAMRTYTEAAWAGAQPLADRVLLDYSGNFLGSHHQKAIFVHSGAQTVGFVGGIDWMNSPGFPRWDPTWHDAAVQLRGAAALRVGATFGTRWAEAVTLPPRTFTVADSQGNTGQGSFNPGTPVADPVLAPPADTVSGKSVQVVRSFGDVKIGKIFGFDVPWADPALVGGVHEVRDTLLKAIAAAARFIYVEDQGFNATDVLFPALVGAIGRGVKVVAVKGGLGDPTDGAGNPAAKMTAEEQSGIYDKITDKTLFAVRHVDRHIVHSKLVLIDDEFCLLGSANFMDRSMQWTFRGTDSEISAAVVDAGTDLRDLRVRLWAQHLDVDPTDATVAAELADLDTALSIFVAGWGTAISFPVPNSRLVPAPPS